MPIVNRAIRDLRLWERNARTPNSETIETLKNSILAHGLLNPITSAIIDGREVVIAGQQRLMAMQSMVVTGEWSDTTQISVNLLGELGNDEALAISTIENIDRLEMDPIAEAKTYQRLSGTRTVNQISDMMNRSATYVRSRLQLLQLPEVDQQRLSRGEITLKAALLLARAGNARRRVNTMLASGVSTQRISQILSEATSIPAELAIFDTRNVETERDLFGNQMISRATFFESQRRAAQAWAEREGVPFIEADSLRDQSELLEVARPEGAPEITPETLRGQPAFAREALPEGVTPVIMLHPQNGSLQISYARSGRQLTREQQQLAQQARHNALRTAMNNKTQLNLALLALHLSGHGALLGKGLTEVDLEGLEINTEEGVSKEISTLRALLGLEIERLQLLIERLIPLQLRFSNDLEEEIARNLNLQGRENEVIAPEAQLELLGDEELTQEAERMGVQVQVGNRARTMRKMLLEGYAVDSNALHPSLRFAQRAE